jgi:O-antigen/teichoic acid export membrane protein
MQKKNPALTNKFVGQGFLLFLDQILVAVTNWIFWIVVSRLASTSEVGQATSVYSLVLLMSTVCQLGLEYPLLKRSSLDRSKILGTTLAIEAILILGLIPVIVLLASMDVYHASLVDVIWVAVGLLVLTPISFVGRFALLGVSNAKSVLVFEILATSAKFVMAYILLSMGFGSFGILFSFMTASLLSAVSMLTIAARRLPIRLIRDKGYFMEVIKEGLSNAPSKLSRIMIVTLSVILLTSFGISDSDIGVFYVAAMISVIGGGLVSSMSFTVIPASSQSKADLSSGSLRIGLTLTAPIIAALIVAPKDILGIIGPEYASAAMILFVLSIGIPASAVVMNAISKFNYLGEGRKITFVGLTQIAAFLASFLVLVPYYGTLGAAISIVVAYTSSATLAVFWLEKAQRGHIARSIVAIIAGCSAGYSISLVLDYSLAVIVSTVVITSAILLVVKSTSPSELRQLIRSVRNAKE